MQRLTGLSLLLFSFVCSCVQQKGDVDSIGDRKIKPVPVNFAKTTDSGFSRHQDTLYFDGVKYSGHLYSLFSNGDSSFAGSFLNGLEEGVLRKWYPNGQLMEERMYVDGKKEGLHRGWWEDGKPGFEYHFVNGEHQGELKEWYISGQLYRLFHYKMGYEEGSQRIWWENGTIRANYAVRNGKKYGLIGLKLCINPHDSIVKK